MDQGAIDREALVALNMLLNSSLQFVSRLLTANRRASVRLGPESDRTPTLGDNENARGAAEMIPFNLFEAASQGKLTWKSQLYTQRLKCLEANTCSSIDCEGSTLPRYRSFPCYSCPRCCTNDDCHYCMSRIELFMERDGENFNRASVFDANMKSLFALVNFLRSAVSDVPSGTVDEAHITTYRQRMMGRFDMLPADKQRFLLSRTEGVVYYDVAFTEGDADAWLRQRIVDIYRFPHELVLADDGATGKGGAEDEDGAARGTPRAGIGGDGASARSEEVKKCEDGARSSGPLAGFEGSDAAAADGVTRTSGSGSPHRVHTSISDVTERLLIKWRTIAATTRTPRCGNNDFAKIVAGTLSYERFSAALNWKSAIWAQGTARLFTFLECPCSRSDEIRFSSSSSCSCCPVCCTSVNCFPCTDRLSKFTNTTYLRRFAFNESMRMFLSVLETVRSEALREDVDTQADVKRAFDSLPHYEKRWIAKNDDCQECGRKAYIDLQHNGTANNEHEANAWLHERVERIWHYPPVILSDAHAHCVGITRTTGSAGLHAVENVMARHSLPEGYGEGMGDVDDEGEKRHEECNELEDEFSVSSSAPSVTQDRILATDQRRCTALYAECFDKHPTYFTVVDDSRNFVKRVLPTTYSYTRDKVSYVSDVRLSVSHFFFS